MDNTGSQKITMYTVNTVGVRGVHRESVSMYMAYTVDVHGVHRHGPNPHDLGVHGVRTDSYHWEGLWR